MSDYDVRETELSPVRGLRLALVRPSGTLTDVEYPGDDHPGAFHVAGFRDENMVAIGSTNPEPMPEGFRTGSWRIRDVAVDQGHRGRGLGAVILERCIEHASNSGGRVAWGIVPAGSIGFVTKYGFRRYGDPITSDDGPQYLAYAELAPMDRPWSI